MNKNNNKMDLLGNAPVPQALMALGIPIMIGMLINALYNLVDAYFIGGLGESQMGAISIAFPLGQVVVGLGLMFGNGAASYLSRLLGRGDREAASKVASTALYSSVCIGAVIIIGTAIFLKPILTMLGATDTIMPYALSYGRIYVISCIFNVFNVTMNNIVASEGAAKTTMCALLLGAVLNIGLDPIFIYTLDMGVAGAAIATAISQMASTLVYLIYALQKKSAFTFSIKEFCPSKQIITEILKIGIPTLTFQLLTSLSIAFINREANIYGDAVIAGMGAVTRITSMGTAFPSFAFKSNRSKFISFHLPSPCGSSGLHNNKYPCIAPLITRLACSFPQKYVLQTHAGKSASVLHPAAYEALSSVFHLTSYSILDISPVPPAIKAAPSFGSPAILRLQFLPPSVQYPPTVLLHQPSGFSSPDNHVVFHGQTVSDML